MRKMQITRDTVPEAKKDIGRERVRLTNTFDHTHLGSGAFYACLESRVRESQEVIASGDAIFIGTHAKFDSKTVLHKGVVVGQRTKIVDSTLFQKANVSVDCTINDSMLDVSVHVKHNCTIEKSRFSQRTIVGIKNEIIGSMFGRECFIGPNCSIKNSAIYLNSRIKKMVNIQNVDTYGPITIGAYARVEDVQLMNIDIPGFTTINSESWFMTFGNVGSRHDQLFVTYSENEIEGALWSTGCQKNISTKAFLERLEGEHDPKSLPYREYKAIIAFVRSHPEFKRRMEARPKL